MMTYCHSLQASNQHIDTNTNHNESMQGDQSGALPSFKASQAAKRKPALPSASVKLRLTIQMMQMMQIAFLTSPAAQKSQKITSNTTSKTLLPRIPKHHLISSLRFCFLGPPPQTPYLLTSFAKNNSAGAFYEGWLS